MDRLKIVSGMRPTGPLHIGHLLGVIENWSALQHAHPSYFFLADWHALTSKYLDTKTIRQMRIEYVKGWIGAGIDPQKSLIYCQSAVPEVLSLSQVFLCLTPSGWADRSPSWKDSKLQTDRIHDNLGFYTYPILQSADIALFKGNLVPVGEDQVAHIEISRDIIGKFNRLYKEIFPIPEAKLTHVPKLVGVDNTKMSSSKGNYISLVENEKSLQKKINKMVTDMNRTGITDAGNPDNCSVFSLHKAFSSANEVTEVNQGCRGAKLGCGECKMKLGNSMKPKLMPISEKIQKISDSDVAYVLADGNKRAQEIARATWQEVQTEMEF